MKVRSVWKSILTRPGSRKVLLLSIVRRDSVDFTSNQHLATIPRAMRFATDLADVDGYPFWPVIQDWPSDLKFTLDQRKRSAPTATATFQLMPQANFPRDQTSPEKYYGRLDLWSDGVSLDDVIPLMEGSISDIQPDPFSTAILVRLLDEESRVQPDFPPGNNVINTLDFGTEVPDAIVDRAPRQTVFGPVVVQIPCYQIDREAKHFYVCDPPMETPPERFFLNGIEIFTRPTVKETQLGGDPTRKFTELVFDESQDPDNKSIYNVVSVQGGMGITTDPLEALLKSIGQYRLTPEAERQIRILRSNFNFSAFFNASGKVIDIVTKRLLPQTDIVMGFRRNRIHAYHLLDDGLRMAAGIGFGLRARLEDNLSLTEVDDVQNVIEVHFTRNILQDPGSALSRNTVTKDKTVGGSMGRLLAKSEKKFGRRALQAPIEAVDLVSVSGESIPVGVEKLATVEALLRAFPPRPYRYLAEWHFGMKLDLNDGVSLTDGDFEDLPARLTEWQLTANGPQIRFELENVV